MRWGERHLFFADLGLAILFVGSSTSLIGCGALPGLDDRAELVSTRDDAPVTGGLVALDWSGGVYPWSSHHALPGLAGEHFVLLDGSTLEDHREWFVEEVRARVQAILDEEPGLRVTVVDGESAGATALKAKVIITQAESPTVVHRIGEAVYDPCDATDQDAAVVFGGEILGLSGVYSADEWANVFANACAHEIAHTLGYGHVPRSGVPAAERSLFAELMLDAHTMDEMKRPQRFLAAQDRCASEESRPTHRSRPVEDPCLIAESSP